MLHATTRSLAALLILTLVYLTASGCERKQPEAPTPGETSAPNAAERLFAEIGERFERIRGEISALETGLGTLPDAQRAQVERTLTEVRAASEDLAHLQAELTGTEEEERERLRLQMWQAYVNTYGLLTEARIEAADNLDELQTIVELEITAREGDLHELQARTSEATPELRPAYAEIIEVVRREQELLRRAGGEATSDVDEARSELLDPWRDVPRPQAM